MRLLRAELSRRRKAYEPSASLRVVGHLVDGIFAGVADSRVHVQVRWGSVGGPPRRQLELFVNDIPLFTFVPGHRLPGADDVGWLYGPGNTVDPGHAGWQGDGLPPGLAEELRLGILPFLAEIPKRFAADNYDSVLTALPQSVAEFERAVELGKLEGPLAYKPYSNMPLGLVVKILFLTGETKLRLVIDASRSMLNVCAVPLTTSYDALPEALGQIGRGFWFAKLDITDAFWVWALSVIFANLFGVKHPAKEEYYRWRYLFFGFSQSPLFQQRFMRLIKRAFRARGIAAAIVFVDDWFVFAPSQALCEQAMLTAVATLEESHGCRCKPSKIEGPERALEYTGLLCSLEAMQLRISDKRAARLAEQARALRAAHEAEQATVDDLHRFACRLNFYGGAVAAGSAAVWPIFEAIRGLPLDARLRRVHSVIGTLRFWEAEAYAVPGQRLLEAEDGTLYLPADMGKYWRRANLWAMRLDWHSEELLLTPPAPVGNESEPPRRVRLSASQDWLVTAIEAVTESRLSCDPSQPLLLVSNWTWLVSAVGKLHHRDPKVVKALRPLVEQLRREGAAPLGTVYDNPLEPDGVRWPRPDDHLAVERELSRALRFSSAAEWDDPVSPALRCVTLLTDGASRGNPGPAAAAAVLEFGTDSTRIELGRHLGCATNNVAEGQAIVLGLEGALERGADDALLLSDSELLVDLLQGRKEARQRVLADLVRSVRLLTRRLRTFAVRHVPREGTLAADRVANEVLDTAQDLTREFWGPQAGLGLPGPPLSLATAVVPGLRIILFPRKEELAKVVTDTIDALTTDPATEVFLIVPGRWGSTKFPELKLFKHQPVDAELVSDIVGCPARLLSHVPQTMPAGAARIRQDAFWIASLASTPPA